MISLSPVSFSKQKIHDWCFVVHDDLYWGKRSFEPYAIERMRRGGKGKLRGGNQSAKTNSKLSPHVASTQGTEHGPH